MISHIISGQFKSDRTVRSSLRPAPPVHFSYDIELEQGKPLNINFEDIPFEHLLCSFYTPSGRLAATCSMKTRLKTLHLKNVAESGKWQIILTAFYPVQADFSFSITQAEPASNSLDITLPEEFHAIDDAFQEPSSFLPNQSPGQQAMWYRGDFHCHTRFSDGYHMPGELEVFARTLNLDLLAITDHNICCAASFSNLTHLNGIELTFDDNGHFNIFGFKTMPDIARLTVSAKSCEQANCLVLNEIKKQGGFCSLNHPFRPLTPLNYEIDPAFFDTYEVINGVEYGQFDDANFKAILGFDLLWLHGYRIFAIAGSDFHTGKQTHFYPGNPTTHFYATSLCEKDVLDSLKSGRSYITLHCNFEFSLVGMVSNQSYTWGDKITEPVRFTGRSSQVLYWRLIIDGKPLQSLKTDVPVFEFDLSARQYARIEARNTLGNVQIFCNPVFQGQPFLNSVKWLAIKTMVEQDWPQKQRDLLKQMIDLDSQNKPLCVAHRGASGWAPENSLDAFRFANTLGADMWELDVYLTQDGICVVSHNDNLEVNGKLCPISETPYDILKMILLKNGEHPASLKEVIRLAKSFDTWLYVEIKGENCEEAVFRELQQSGYAKVCVGSFHIQYLKKMHSLNCPYPLSVLVGINEDPFEKARACHADMIHLCWESACDTPSDLVTTDLLQKAQEKDLLIHLWHEERQSELEKLMQMPVQCICTNNPEKMQAHVSHKMMPVSMVLHRGASQFTPENTLQSARLGISMGAGFIELDVNTTKDGQLVVIHDETLDRTTDQSGRVCDFTFIELQNVNTGHYVSEHFSHCRLSRLEDYLILAKESQTGLYIELKNAEPANVLACVLKYDMLNHVFFWSPHKIYVDEIEINYPDAHIMRRRQDYTDLKVLLDESNPDIIEYDYIMDDLNELAELKTLGMMKKQGLMETQRIKSLLRYPGQDENLWLTLLKFNPDMVNIDYPYAFSNAYRQYIQTISR